MRIHHLYEDENGESHFGDIEVEWEREIEAGKLSARMPATGFMFREAPPTYRLDFHNAPRRQYAINLDAPSRITASDGETRVIGPGEIVLVEDLHGKGHASQAIDGKIRRVLNIILD